MFYGRGHELKLLEEHSKSGRAEFAIISGRRRIGKSELIKQFMRGKRALYFEAIEHAPQAMQINHFLVQLSEQLKVPKYDCKTWREVFDVLGGVVKEGRWIVAFDEFPWMASGRSALVSLLKYYWDQKWKSNAGLMLILCGSVASFMIDHIVHSRALHNRKTLEMKLDHLLPADVKAFLGRRSAWETAEIMMAVGGVPKYLEVLDPKKSAKINFNREFFTKDGFFVNELETIFKEQFRKTAYYESIVRSLAEESLGLTEIGRRISFESGGSLRKYLANLEMAGFVEEWGSISMRGFKTRTKKYRLADPFLRTYFKFIEPNRKRILRNTGSNLVDAIMGDVWDSFFGQAFDWFVDAHFERLLEILEIPAGDVIQYGPFFRQRSRGRGKKAGVQVDLMIIRKDDVVTVIENKFTREPVGAAVQDEVQAKIDQLGFPKTITIEKVLVSASGASKGVREGNFFDRIITLEELFCKP